MDAFRAIREITGEEENEKLIERFIEMEDKNFAMFTCKFMPFTKYRRTHITRKVYYHFVEKYTIF